MFRQHLGHHPATIKLLSPRRPQAIGTPVGEFQGIHRCHKLRPLLQQSRIGGEDSSRGGTRGVHGTNSKNGTIGTAPQVDGITTRDHNGLSPQRGGVTKARVGAASVAKYQDGIGDKAGHSKVHMDGRTKGGKAGGKGTMIGPSDK